MNSSKLITLFLSSIIANKPKNNPELTTQPASNNIGQVVLICCCSGLVLLGGALTARYMSKAFSKKPAGNPTDSSSSTTGNPADSSSSTTGNPADSSSSTTKKPADNASEQSDTGAKPGKIADGSAIGNPNPPPVIPTANPKGSNSDKNDGDKLPVVVDENNPPTVAAKDPEQAPPSPNIPDYNIIKASKHTAISYLDERSKRHMNMVKSAGLRADSDYVDTCKKYIDEKDINTVRMEISKICDIITFCKESANVECKAKQMECLCDYLKYYILIPYYCKRKFNLDSTKNEYVSHDSDTLFTNENGKGLKYCLERIKCDIDLLEEVTFEDKRLSDYALEQLNPKDIPNAFVMPIIMRAKICNVLNAHFNKYDFTSESLSIQFNNSSLYESIATDLTDITKMKSLDDFDVEFENIVKIITSVPIKVGDNKTEYVKKMLTALKQNDKTKYGIGFCNMWVEEVYNGKINSGSIVTKGIKEQCELWLKSNNVEAIIKLMDALLEISDSLKIFMNQYYAEHWQECIQKLPAHGIEAPKLIHALQKAYENDFELHKPFEHNFNK